MIDLGCVQRNFLDTYKANDVPKRRNTTGSRAATRPARGETMARSRRRRARPLRGDTGLVSQAADTQHDTGINALI
jgi:hypothetical protein